MEQDVITSLIEGVLRVRILRIEELPAGANSRVFLVLTSANGRYLVKKYRASRPGDHRDRLRTEFKAMRFLWDSGFPQISRPYFHDPERRIGVYQYIEGRKLASHEISNRHLDAIAAFLHQLHRLQHSPASSDQALASEACLCLRDYAVIVGNRLERLLAIPENDDQTTLLRSYLENVVTPFFCRARDLLTSKAAGMGLDPLAELPKEKRILSPSDLGFRNIIVTGEEQLIFIDFEYFGWDDPAKLISDFFLQPAVPLPSELRGAFLEKLDFLCANDPELSKRLPFAYLFSALKWCLLVLNCFFGDDTAAPLPWHNKLRLEKLALSRSILQNLEEEMAGKKFPVALL